MELSDDVFYYQVLPYVDFRTLYHYRHQPEVAQLYHHRVMLTPGEAIEAAIENDYLDLFAFAVVSYPRVPNEVCLKLLTSKPVPVRILSWFASYVEENQERVDCEIPGRLWFWLFNTGFYFDRSEIAAGERRLKGLLGMNGIQLHPTGRRPLRCRTMAGKRPTLRRPLKRRVGRGLHGRE